MRRLVLTCVGVLLAPAVTLGQYELWRTRFDIGGADEVPVAVALDSEGRVVVTGSISDGADSTDLTVAYDASGNYRWHSVDHSDDQCTLGVQPQAIVVAGTGDPIIGGTTRCENAHKALLFCLDSASGATEWHFRSDAASFWDPLTAFVSDGEGGAYLVVDLDIGPWWYGVFRILGDGTVVWRTEVGSLDSIHGSAAAVGNGLLYIAGTIERFVRGADPQRSRPQHNIFVAAVSADGEVEWTREFDFTPGEEDQRSIACATDPAGNVAVLIQTTQWSPQGSDYEVLKLNPSGDVLWYERFDAAAGEDVGAALACGPDGSVFVTGRSWSGPVTGYDMTTLKFDPLGGTPVWVTRAGGIGAGDDEGRAIAVDALGNVVVTGACDQGPERGRDMVTLVYDSDGGESWREIYVGPAGDDVPVDLELSGGKVAVVGESVALGGLGHDYAIVVYGGFPVAVAEQYGSVPLATMTVAPNPTRGRSTCHIENPTVGRVAVRVYDVTGRMIRELLNTELPAGAHVVAWDGRDAGGVPVRSGIYFYRFAREGRSLSHERVAVIR